MGDDGNAKWHGPGSWRRRALIALGACALLFIFFHRPLLLTLGEKLARHYAAKDDLKLDLRLEGSVFTNLTAKNVHAVPNGLGPVEAIDIEYAHFTYSLVSLIRHGSADFLRTVEVRNARVVIDPSRAKLKKPPPPNERITLPDIFPEVVRLSDVSFLIKDKPYDTVLEHVFLDLNPGQSGELRMAALDLAGGQKFEKVAAQTSYKNRHLILTNLELGGDRIASLEVDASNAQRGTLGVKTETDLGGGHVSLTGSLREEGNSLRADLHLQAAAVAAESLNKYIGSDAKLAGTIENLGADATGIFNIPKTWTGRVEGKLQGIRQDQIGVDSCDLRATAQNGELVLESTDIAQGENRFVMQGTLALPTDVRDFGRVPARLEMSGAAVDLARVTSGMPLRLTGSAQLKGHFDVREGTLHTELSVTAGPVGFENGSVETLNATVTASRLMPEAKANKPWFAGLKSNVTVDVGAVHLRDYVVDSAQVAIATTDDTVKFDHATIKRAANDMTVQGEYRLPSNLREFDKQPARITATINAPEVAEFWEKQSADTATGPLQMQASIDWQNGMANGQFFAYGGELKWRDLVLHQLSSQGVITNSVVYLNDFTAALNQHDFVSASGRFDLRQSRPYAGKVSLAVADLSVFQPLLRAAGNQNQLAGTLSLNWDGAGELGTLRNSGSLKLSLEKGRYGTLQSLQARVDADYAPEGLNVPIIFLASNKMDFQAVAQAKGETFEISKIQLNQGPAKYASGYLSIPFVWKNLGTNAEVFPANGKVTINFQSENLQLKQVFEDVGMKAPASGVLNVKIDGNGTLDQLQARLEVQARDLRSEQLPNFEPATFDLTAEAKGDRLTVLGKLQQAKIQPVELTASLPFNGERVARDHGLRDDTPITAKLHMPRSSVNFIRQFAPQVEQLDGDAGLDVDVSGTIAKPVFTGSADMTVNVARSSNVTLPALREFKARLVFNNDSLKFEQFGGDLSGGKFTVMGGVKFVRLTQANLDLQLKADSVLVARNDSLTARANADVKVTGPFTGATVKGTVELTNSQFLKNLDLIPIGLPGRPAPQPPESRPQFSFPQPPLRDWKFDVAIKTKDPFKIRGNLANGGAVVDLHLIGTGLRPGLQGMVRMQNVEATLPFSRLQIAYGFLYFDPSDSLNPKMDMHGTSVVRDYTIHVYIYGTSLAPQAIFSSEPPLPQEEVISLLATGTTREQLTGNNNVLAGRAAMLLVQQLYRKAFNKGQGPQNSSVFDRLDVDIGQTDPRTGQQQATARFKVDDHFVLVGDLDVGGGFRGMVKYLIRFH